jgi:hypothetical protein
MLPTVKMSPTTSKVVLFVRAKVQERKESFHDNAISKTKDYEKQQTLNYNKNTLILKQC